MSRIWDNGKSATSLEFEHYNFENHANGAEEYLKMMNGEKGWEFILNSYKKYCES